PTRTTPARSTAIRTRRGQYREMCLRIHRFDVRGPVEIERFDESKHILRKLSENHDAYREERVTVEDRDLPQGVGIVENRPNAQDKPPNSEERDEPREPR